MLTAVLGVLIYMYSSSSYYVKECISSIKPVGRIARFCSHVKNMFFSPVGKFSKVYGDSLSLKELSPIKSVCEREKVKNKA